MLVVFIDEQYSYIHTQTKANQICMNTFKQFQYFINHNMYLENYSNLSSLQKYL
jgi:hypothetical protein